MRLRGNFSISIKPNLTLDINSGYIRRDLYNAFEGTFFAGMTFQYMTGPGFKNATNGLQREFVGDVFGVEGKLRDDRFTGGGSLNWQPFTWLTARAVAGIDQTNSFGYRQQLKGAGSAGRHLVGSDLQRGRQGLRSLEQRAVHARRRRDGDARLLADDQPAHVGRRAALLRRAVPVAGTRLRTPARRVDAQLGAAARVVGVHDRGSDVRRVHRGGDRLARPALPHRRPFAPTRRAPSVARPSARSIREPRSRT